MHQGCLNRPMETSPEEKGLDTQSSCVKPEGVTFVYKLDELLGGISC